MNRLIKSHLELKTHNENYQNNITLSKDNLISNFITLESLYKDTIKLDMLLYTQESLENVVSEIKDIIEEQNNNLKKLKKDNNIDIEEPQEESDNQPTNDDNQIESNDTQDGDANDSPETPTDTNEEISPDEENSMDEDINTPPEEHDQKENEDGDGETNQEESNPEEDKNNDQEEKEEQSNSNEKDDSKEDKDNDISQECLKLYSCAGRLGIDFKLDDVSNESLFKSLGINYNREDNHSSFVATHNNVDKIANDNYKNIINNLYQLFHSFKTNIQMIKQTYQHITNEINTFIDNGEFISIKNEQHPIDKEINIQLLTPGNVFDCNILDIHPYEWNNNRYYFLNLINQYIINSKLTYINVETLLEIFTNIENNLKPIKVLEDGNNPVFFIGNNKMYYISKDSPFLVEDQLTVTQTEPYKLKDILLSILNMIMNDQFINLNENENILNNIIKHTDDLKTIEYNRYPSIIILMLIKESMFYSLNTIRSYRWLQKNI